MTDQSLPGPAGSAPGGAPATRPWPLAAPPGCTARQWGRLDGTLAVAALKAEPGGVHEVRPRAASCSGPGPPTALRAARRLRSVDLTSRRRTCCSPRTTTAATTRCCGSGRSVAADRHRSGGPAEPGGTAHDGREPEQRHRHRDPGQPGRVRRPPGDRQAPAPAPRRRPAPRPPTRASRAGSRGSGTARTPSRSSRRTATARPAGARGAPGMPVTRSVLEVVVPPRVGVPLLVALLDLLERPSRLRRGGVGAEPVDVRALSVGPRPGGA